MNIKYSTEETYNRCETCGRLPFPHPRCAHERTKSTNFIAELFKGDMVALYAEERRDQDFESFKKTAELKLKAV